MCKCVFGRGSFRAFRVVWGGHRLSHLECLSCRQAASDRFVVRFHCQRDPIILKFKTSDRTVSEQDLEPMLLLTGANSN